VSLLTLCQSVSVRVGLLRPNAAYTSADPQVQQIIEFANEEGQQLAARHPWQVLTNEASFATVALEPQGSILTIAGAGFKYILNETIWNRSQRRPVFGPRSPGEWQALKATFINGPWNQFRIRGNQILFTPIPAAGQSCFFEWVSARWCTVAAGGTSDVWLSDADTSLLDERIMGLGVVWRWKAAKGLEYAEDYAKYEREVEDAMARDGGKPRLNLNGGSNDLPTVVLVPAGNWMVS